MITVKLYSQTDTIDFLVLTEPKFESAINDLSTMLNIPIRMKMCDTLNNVLDSCYARYSIFEYEHIHNYQKILYLDTDIIVQNDLTTLFNIDIEDRIYAIPEGSIQFDAWGGMFFDFTTIDKSTSGINAGILLFKNTEFSRMLFKDITDHITFMKRIGCCMPEMADQPFLNFHCIKSNRQDIILMNKYGCMYTQTYKSPPSSTTDVILCHYAWPMGNMLHKKNRILKHVTHILNNYTNLLKDPKPFVVPNIIGNRYSWGNTIITFADNSTIQTTWAIYNYKWLDEFTLEANWSKYSHIFRFNSNYTNYICVRKDNLEYINGFLTTSTIDMIFLNELLKNQFTMVPMKRLLNLYNNCSLFTNTSHSFVECGVAKGGCLAVMKKLAGLNNKVFGFDSFEGLPAITQDDISDYNKGNPSEWVGINLSGGIENVYKTFQALQLDMTNVHLIKGLFQDTLVQQEIIDKIGPIAVLRLDGDWYESIKVCLEALYDKVIVGGVIILDDYGHWVGNKKATDEFRQKRNILSPLIQTDYSEYYWIKTNDFENRNDMLTYYSNTIDKPKILEIGIFKGEFFDFIANNCSIGLLDGVDLFVGTGASGDHDGNNFIWYNLEQSFNELTEKYKNNPNVNLHKSDSSTYLKSKMDDYYDIIYIDGDHTYEGCKRDLIEAFKKIKHGGYIMGHDYEMNMNKAKMYWKCGVNQAVNEFCDTYKQIIIAKAMDGCVGFCIRIDKTSVPLAAGKI
jgi:lipopolysaccharide biosynthesis glycosyltransferase